MESSIASALGVANSTYWTGTYPALHPKNTIWLTLINQGSNCASFDINTFGNSNQAPAAYEAMVQKTYTVHAPMCNSTTQITNLTNSTGNITTNSTNSTNKNITNSTNSTKNTTNSTKNTTNSTVNNTTNGTNSTGKNTTNATNGTTNNGTKSTN
jgi:hypothetical protein